MILNFWWFTDLKQKFGFVIFKEIYEKK